MIGFYLLVDLPEAEARSAISTTRSTTLNTRISTAEESVAAAESARKAFPRNYSEIVSMGSAVPEDSDQATLIYDLTKVSDAARRPFPLLRARGCRRDRRRPDPGAGDHDDHDRLDREHVNRLGRLRHDHRYVDRLGHDDQRHAPP